MDHFIRMCRVASLFAAAVVSAGTAWSAPTKNAGATTNAWSAAPFERPSVSALETLPASYIHCSDQRSDTQQISSITFAALRQCSIDSPNGGVVTIIGSSSLALSPNTVANQYEAQFDLAIDSIVGSGLTDRWVNSRADSGDGSDKSVALSSTRTVTAGRHTFYLLARRFSSTGAITLYDSSLSVVLVPAPVATSTTCGLTANNTFSTTSATNVVVAQCALTVAEGQVALMIGTTSMGPTSNAVANEYEANFSLSIDSATTGLDSTDRWVNTYADGGDGVDETMAVSTLVPLAAGPHTFRLLVRRAAGTGTVFLYDPALSVIVVPQASACGGAANQTFRSSSNVAAIAQQCSAMATGTADALVIATASIAMSSNTAAAETEWFFRLRVDGADTLNYTDRWVNVYADTGGDGNDRNMMDNAIVPLSAGPHTFALYGSRFSGTADAVAYDPTIAIILLASDKLFANGFEN